MPFSESKLTSIFDSMQNKRLAVVGDLMLDRYIWGSVGRISPEAPVPVVEVNDESNRLGGAANVGNNIVALGGQCLLIGVVGNDNHADVVRLLTEDAGMEAGGILTDPNRPTTVKTRVIAHHQHVVRIDREVKSDIQTDMEQQILDKLESQIEALDGIILQDYNKGVMTAALIRSVIELANRHDVIITVDPKLTHFLTYENVTVFKPNLKETAEGLGRRIKSDAEVIDAGFTLLNKLKARHVLITRSEKGMSLFTKDKNEPEHIDTHARKVADVSGAGDTVIATLTLALAAGNSMSDAAQLANLAGGFVVGEVGIVPASRGELLKFWKQLRD